MKLRKIEVCCTSVDDVMEAYYGGAIRVELCSAISCGSGQFDSAAFDYDVYVICLSA